jgi:hypothetical protein
LESQERVSVEQARAEAEALIERLRREFSENDPRHQGVEVHLGSLHEQVAGTVRRALMVLLAAVGFVLLDEVLTIEQRVSDSVAGPRF